MISVAARLRPARRTKPAIVFLSPTPMVVRISIVAVAMCARAQGPAVSRSGTERHLAPSRDAGLFRCFSLRYLYFFRCSWRGGRGGGGEWAQFSRGRAAAEKRAASPPHALLRTPYRPARDLQMSESRGLTTQWLAGEQGRGEGGLRLCSSSAASWVASVGRRSATN